jgi:hypothetical protein
MARVIAGFLCLLVILSGLMPVGRLLRCRIDGSVRLDCCCAIPADGGAGCVTMPGAPACCCDVTVLPPHAHQVMPVGDDLPVLASLFDVLPPVRGPPVVLVPAVRPAAPVVRGTRVTDWKPPPIRIRFCSSLT